MSSVCKHFRTNSYGDIYRKRLITYSMKGKQLSINGESPPMACILYWCSFYLSSRKAILDHDTLHSFIRDIKLNTKICCDFVHWGFVVDSILKKYTFQLKSQNWWSMTQIVTFGWCPEWYPDKIPQAIILQWELWTKSHTAYTCTTTNNNQV